MTEPRWHELPDGKRLQDAVVAHIADILRDGIRQRGQVTLVVPGGRTPEAMLQKLSRLDLPWAQITVLPGDDRYVAPTHPASNFGLIQRALGHTGARLMPLVDSGHLDDLDDAATSACQRLASIARPFDLVWLGMGIDGHVASLFPGQPLTSSSGPVMAAVPQPLPAEAPFARLTLTLDALLDSRALMLVITASDKREVLHTAASEGSESQYPAGRLLAASRVPVSIFWSART